MAEHPLHRPPLHCVHLAQRGISLIFTLIALVLLMLTAAALVRSVDTVTLVMGNLGFKQDSTNLSTDSTAGAEAAIAYIVNNYSSLTKNIPAQGYYASSLDDLDPTGGTRSPTLAVIDWNDDNCVDMVKDSTYNGTCVIPSAKLDIKDGSGKVIGSANYLISRLCSAEGDPSGKDAGGNPVMCSKPPSVGTSTSEARGEIGGKSPSRPDVSVVGPYFRIVVRAVGGRNTVSFTETLVHF